MRASSWRGDLDAPLRSIHSAERKPHISAPSSVHPIFIIPAQVVMIQDLFDGRHWKGWRRLYHSRQLSAFTGLTRRQGNRRGLWGVCAVEYGPSSLYCGFNSTTSGPSQRSYYLSRYILVHYQVRRSRNQCNASNQRRSKTPVILESPWWQLAVKPQLWASHEGVGSTGRSRSIGRGMTSAR